MGGLDEGLYFTWRNGEGCLNGTEEAGEKRGEFSWNPAQRYSYNLLGAVFVQYIWIKTFFSR